MGASADDILWRRSKLGLHLTPDEQKALREHMTPAVKQKSSQAREGIERWPTIILAIDQGTTSSRAIVFDTKLQAAGPRPRRNSGSTSRTPAGWSMIRRKSGQSVLATCKAAIKKAKASRSDIAAIGITNQRETTVVWDRKTGKPIHNAIVWQDRRTADICAELKAAGHEPLFTAKTGLLLDPYFSGTKIAWLLDHVKGARDAGRARRTVPSAPSTAS